MSSDVGSTDDHSAHATRARTGEPNDTSPGPWTRVLGILVLGSFAAATKTARASRRDAGRRDPATVTQPEAAA